MPQTNKITALYCRLSQEDMRLGESESIQNQKKILERYAKENLLPNIRFFIDDGISGVRFEREGLQSMLEEVEAGNVSTVITKDLSRLGRDYLKTGELIEIVFPENNVRYIAINDNVDTARGDNEFTPIRNWCNEFYARDTSKKIRAVMHEKAMRGERANGEFPYGYLPDPDNRNHLVPDEETAPVVLQIFKLYADGARVADIQNWLKENRVCTPAELRYRRMKNNHFPRPKPECIYNWSAKTICDILKRPEYIGSTVTNKFNTVSYKSKKRKENSDEDCFFFKNTHEPLISNELFETVQRRLETRHRPIKRTNLLDLFSGLIFCGECGGKLYALHGSEECRKNAYSCGSYHNYKRGRQSSRCTAHYVRQDLLISIVLEDIKRVLLYVNGNEREFISAVSKNVKNDSEAAEAQRKCELAKAEERVSELNMLFRRSYEDNVKGKISDEQFSFLTADFDDEKRKLENRIYELSKELDIRIEYVANVKKFVSLAKIYADLSELNYENVHALIDRILVHEMDEEHIRKIEIFYRFVGKIPNDGKPVEISYYVQRMGTDVKITLV